MSTRPVQRVLAVALLAVAVIFVLHRAGGDVEFGSLGTVRAEVPPVVVVTSNRTREVHDALKRRCLYHWVEHPRFEREVEIVRARVPEASEALARQVAQAVAVLRSEDLLKPPGVAETIDWTLALVALGAERLDADTATATLGAVLGSLGEELSTSIRGRDLMSGLPRELELGSEEVRRAIDARLARGLLDRLRRTALGRVAVAGGDDRHPDLVLELLVHHRAEDDVRVGVRGRRDGLGRLVDLP